MRRLEVSEQRQASDGSVAAVLVELEVDQRVVQDLAQLGAEQLMQRPLVVLVDPGAVHVVVPLRAAATNQSGKKSVSD